MEHEGRNRGGWMDRSSLTNCLSAGLLVLLSFGLGCGVRHHREQSPSGTTCIRMTGSSTLYPLSVLVAEQFEGQHPGVRVEVVSTGSGAGFRDLCARQADIVNASRPVRKTELNTCREMGIEFVELPVAFDAICVVVNPANTWARSITVEQLRRLWEPEAEGRVRRWNQLRPDWPAAPIHLYGPGPASGTFDYFTEAILGAEGVSRRDYSASEDDGVLVEKVAADPYALGYFGLSHYLRNRESLAALAIDDANDTNGRGAQPPTVDNVIRAVYQPLSRPLFLYVSDTARPNPEVQIFVEFYLRHAPQLAGKVGCIPLRADLYNWALERFKQDRFGSAFGGAGATTGLTMSDLFDMSLEDLLDVPIE